MIVQKPKRYRCVSSLSASSGPRFPIRSPPTTGDGSTQVELGGKRVGAVTSASEMRTRSGSRRWIASPGKLHSRRRGPNAPPPSASIKKQFPDLKRSMPPLAVLAAAAIRTVKITTPTPLSRSFDLKRPAHELFNVERTAIGSVGLMSAPKTRAHANQEHPPTRSQWRRLCSR